MHKHLTENVQIEEDHLRMEFITLSTSSAHACTKKREKKLPATYTHARK